MRTAGLLLVFLCSLAGLTGQATPLRVLFLGNSLTDGNDVPSLVQAMAKLQGVTLEYTTVAPGGYALEDHWHDNHQALLKRGFDVVILQQGPSTLPESQANLRQWALTWAEEARRWGATPTLYMIWPVRGQTGGFALVSQSYRSAAVAADAAIFPAGECWEDVLQADPSVALYSNDGLHATPAGSFLAAMVIARGLVSLDPAKIPTRVEGITISAGVLAQFRTAVSALEPRSLSGSAPAAPSSPVAPASPPATPTPAASGKSGGGGAPSLGSLLALAGAALIRLRSRHKSLRR